MKQVKIIETSINPVTFKKQTKVRFGYVDPNKDYKKDFEEWKSKVLNRSVA